MMNGWGSFKVKYEGKIFQTGESGDLIVLEYINYKMVKVKFLNTGNISVVKASDLRKGEAKDKSASRIQNQGIVGSDVLDVGYSNTKEYIHWQCMLQRCYSDKYQSRGASYKGCSMSENFKYFPYFKEWCSKQVGFGNKGWELDKDILIKGNKIYSEDTCCFVPQEVNLIFGNNPKNRSTTPIGVQFIKSSGKYRAIICKNTKSQHISCHNTAEDAFYAYKQVKEDYIKEIANKWKDQIDPRVYEALMKYEVEITD